MMPLRLESDASPLLNAYHMARVAKAVYSDTPGAFRPEVAEAFPLLRTFRKGRTFGLVGANERHAVVAFRGTSGNNEWLEGLAYGQVDEPPGRVHGGLAEALGGLWNELLAALYDANALDKTLWLAGHSLGGSLAVLAARRLERQGYQPNAVFTFGAPTVLDADAAKSFSIPAWRFINNEDAVPGLPWPVMFDSYRHVGERVHFLATGRIAENRHSEGLARKLDRADAIGMGPILAGPFHDHAMDRYIARLAAHAADPALQS